MSHQRIETGASKETCISVGILGRPSSNHLALIPSLAGLVDVSGRGAERFLVGPLEESRPFS